MAQTQKTLIVFDLISTLTDAGPRYVKAFSDMCAELGVEPPKEEELLASLGEMNLSQITDHFVGKLTPAQKEKFMNSCNQACDSLLHEDDWHEALYPNVREVLQELKDKGYTLGIYTGTREDALDAQLDYHGIREFFDPAYIRAKNNARDGDKDSDALKTEQLTSIIAEFKKDQDTAHPRIVMIGDSPSDAKAAQNLGLAFVGFGRDSKMQARLKGAGVTAQFKKFKELPEIVDRFLEAIDRLVAAMAKRQPPSPSQRFGS